MVTTLAARRPILSRLRRTTLVLTAGLVLAVSGCGASEEDEARDAVKAYITAIADGDAKKACDSLTEDSKKRFGKARTKCEDAFENFGGSLSREQKDRLKSVDPEVKVQGNSATTTVDAPPFEGEIRLEKAGDEWKVATR
jgi:hypothetical protein